ncbi:MAG: DUF3810 domain-containing protein [Ruminococcus sp.]|nr:DUF3810 domain-containing protein [Ruminococcus sp.]
MKLKKNTIVLFSVAVFTVILNIVAWTSKGFCDFYVEKIFPLWINTYSRFTSVFPFSVGEILIIIGLLLVVFGTVSYAVLIYKKEGKRLFITKIYGKTVAWIMVSIALIQTLNCFILYHCTNFGDRYGMVAEEHTVDDLVKLGEIVTAIANEYAEKVERDDEGRFIAEDNLGDRAIEAMQKLGEDYPQLKGFYPNPKPVMNSFFMSQQYLMGIYFPFTLEANYNKDMYKVNLPDTLCHELAHLKGFILEDEANFIAYLACIKSCDKDFIYSGATSALKYIRNNIEDYGTEEDIINFYENLSPYILLDWNMSYEHWEEVQNDDSAIIPSDIVNTVGDIATDTSLKLNGVKDGKNSYGRMIDLMLDYYYEEIRNG